jgi:hypothetical protein
MITLTEALQALTNEFEELTRLEQKLDDNTCEHGQDYLVNKIVECEKMIRELDEEIKLLESEK